MPASCPASSPKGWGGSEIYTSGQIEVAVRELKLDPACIGLGFARFLPENQFDTLLNRMAVQVTYAEVRELFGRFSPIVPAWSPDERIGPVGDG